MDSHQLEFLLRLWKVRYMKLQHVIALVGVLVNSLLTVASFVRQHN